MSQVAVVISCFNLGRELQDALASLDQQARPPAEIVVVDDGSDDVYTQHVLASVASQGVAVVRTPNRGVAAARNLGVSLTDSPLVVLLDADDALAPNYLERLAAVLDANPDLGFVTCGIEAFGEATYTWVPPPLTWIDTMVRGGPHISTMFRRALWAEVGGFDPALDGYEDQAFWLSVLRKGWRGEVVPDPLLRYRVRAGSRYRQAIQDNQFARTMARIRETCPAPPGTRRTDLLVEHDRFRLEQQAHEVALRARLADLQQQIAALDHDVRRLETAAVDAGVAPFDWGDARRTSPASPVWGLDRGGPLDRHYIEDFLATHQRDIRGRVLEVKDDYYTRRFGGSRATAITVLDIDASNPQATLIADLADGAALPSDAFECVVLTQTLHIIYDIEAVLRGIFKMLAPGGVLLCTVPCVSRVNYEDGGLDHGDFWRFTEASIRRLASDVFGPDQVEVGIHGNVLTCAAFLLGLSPQEVPAEQLDHIDPSFPLLCTLRAVKPAPGAPTPVHHLTGDVSNRVHRGAVLLYHRVGRRDPDVHELCVDEAIFEDQMRQLAAEFVPLPLDELIERGRKGTMPARAVAVTFDDGYLEHLTVVAPVLQRHGIPATFFVNTADLELGAERWWDVVERIFLSGDPVPALLDPFGDGTWTRPTGTPRERAAAHRAVVEWMYPASTADRRVILNALVRWSELPLHPRESHRSLTGEEIEQLAGVPGVTIGAHTVNHLALPYHPVEIQTLEILENKATLERLLRRRVSLFAYPYGHVSRLTTDAVRAAGLQAAVTTEPGTVGLGTTAYLTPRLEAGPSNDCTIMDEVARLT